MSGYTTDILTDQAIDWLKRQATTEPGRPFFLVLSHKAVHAEFEPSLRHRGRYADVRLFRTQTRWLIQRQTIEGSLGGSKSSVSAGTASSYMYHGAMKFDDFYRA